MSRLTSPGAAIFANSSAFATPFSSYGNATGGLAIASESITNSGVLISTGGRGIEGGSLANASGYGGYHSVGPGLVGRGGTATANTSIVNTGDITSYREGIYGRARAYAKAYGTDAFGGTATARLEITNTADIATSGDNAPAIFAFSLAEAGGYGTNYGMQCFENAMGDEVCQPLIAADQVAER